MSKKWVKSVGIRCIKTMAQAAIGVIGSSAVLSQVDWKVCLSTVLLSGVTCILMNISQIKEEVEE